MKSRRWISAWWVAALAAFVMVFGAACRGAVSYRGSVATGTNFPALLQNRSGQRLDANSLVPGDLGLTTWLLDAPTVAPVVRALVGTSSSGVQSLLGVNAEANTPPSGYLERPFRVPVGVTGVAEELDEVQLGFGDATTGACALQLYDATGRTQVGSYSFTPTAVSAAVTTGTITVIAGNEYRARLVTASSGGTQCRFLAARMRVRPTLSTDPFWYAFVRLEVDATNLQANARRGRTNPRFATQSPLSFVDLYTSAPELRVELYDSLSWHFTAGQITAQVQVNGDAYAALTPTSGVDTSYQRVVLPTALPSPQRVRVTSSTQDVAGWVSSQQLDPVGLFVDAIYAPQGSYLEALPATVRKAVVLADSKGAGFLASLIGGTSYAELLHQHGWDISVYGMGADTLAAEAGTTLTTGGSVATLAYALIQGRPDLVLIEIGRNDYFNGTLSPANLVTQLGNLADAIHAASPGTYVAFWTFTHETSEPTTGGTALNVVRNNVLALCATRAPWCLKIDDAGTTLSSQSAYLKDGTHRNDPGQDRSRRAIETSVFPGSYDWPFKPSDLSPIAWYESDVGLAGGTMGPSVSCSGTCSPTVTASGSPTNPLQVFVLIRTGGALGASTFDASADGGRSWPYRGIATAASVPLFGTTWSFGAGAYSVLDSYYQTSAPGNWADMLGSGNTFTANSPAGFATNKINGYPGLRFTGGASGQGDWRQTISISQPFTLFVVAALDSSSGNQVIIGRNGSGANVPLVYTASGVPSCWSAGGAITGSTSTPTAVHAYACTYNGASSSLWFDGVQTTGTLSTTAASGLSIGADHDLALTAAGYIYSVGIISGAATSDQVYAWQARMRAKYLTP